MGGDLGVRIAEDGHQCISSQSRACLQRDAGLATGWGGMPALYEDGDLGRRRVVVDGQLDQGGGAPPSGVAARPVGERGKLIGHVGQHFVDNGSCRPVQPSPELPPRLVQ